MSINPKVIDLSHWDPAHDFGAVKAAGYVGVIFKATQSTGMHDSYYVRQKAAALAAGLKWGSYHFADRSNVLLQADNYLQFASPDPDELFCLDWEDNNGNKMTAAQAQQWIEKVETALGRPGQCVLYAGNTAKEALGHVKSAFFGARRLWLCQYGAVPHVQASWDTYWLWQFTDGQVGPQPHSVPGVGHCDINHYAGSSEQLAAEWTTGALLNPGATS